VYTTRDSPAESHSQAAFPPPLFAITVAKKGDSHVICVEGELDLSECPRLECALREAEVSPTNRILLDLERLTFIDAAGLSVLVMAWRRSVSNGDRLRVAGGRGNVAYILHLTALDTVLPFIRA
jgi:anti-sigma B factor antagonist